MKMKCVKCDRKAVAELPYASKTYCRKHFLEHYETRVRREISKYKMMNKKEKIAVGVSGGKDSMALLFLLHKLGYNIKAILIDEGAKEYRGKMIPFVKKLCKRLGVPLHVFTFKKEYGKTLDEIMKTKRFACSYCGVLRRTLLNKAARSIRADKLVIGHNMDDEAQTIMMNMFRSELVRLARSGPVVGVVSDKKFVKKVKPLRQCSEKENVIYCLLNGIEYTEAKCPYAHEALRNSVRNALNALEEEHPGVKVGIVHSFDRMLPFLREYFVKKDVGKPNRCPECGELTSGRVCKACEMLGAV
ncbi:MAG: TIGR00269 family protein [archaeon]